MDLEGKREAWEWVESSDRAENTTCFLGMGDGEAGRAGVDISLVKE